MPTDPNDPKTPVTVAADSLPTVQINGVVWQQTVIGNTVYVAGSFSKARPAGSAAGSNEVTRSNLLAYDLTTGALKTDFVANLNAQAKSIAKSPDGSVLYVGGDFTTVNGISRSRVAALSPSTGAPLSGFVPIANGQVKSIVAAASGTVYLGGSFSKLNNVTRNKIGAVNTSGGLLSGFTPKIVDGTVQAMVISPAGDKLVVGGSFTTLNGSGNPGYGLGAVNPTTGANLTFNANSLVRDAGANAAILSLSADGSNFYGTGYVYGAGGNLEGAFSANWSDTKIKWVEDCHGDSYGVYPSVLGVYVASHAHYCGNVGGFPETSPRSYQRAMAFSPAATGTVSRNTVGSYYNFGGQPAPSILTWFPDINTGSYTGQGQGPWTVTGSGSYVLFGGEFTTVNFGRQQGLARFATQNLAPNRQGPRASGADFTPTVSSTVPGTVVVSWKRNWDRDNANLTYQVYQDNVVINTRTAASTFWNRATTTYTQTGVTSGTHSYKINVKDPFGNSVTSPTVTYNMAVGAAAQADAQALRQQMEAGANEAGDQQESPQLKTSPKLVDPTPSQATGTPSTSTPSTNKQSTNKQSTSTQSTATPTSTGQQTTAEPREEKGTASETQTETSSE